MTTLYTIGYKGKPLSDFIGQLREAGVDVVIDVRLRNTSHLAGYTKRDDLAFLLREGFSIAYEHRPDLPGRERGGGPLSPVGRGQGRGAARLSDYVARWGGAQCDGRGAW